MHVWKVEFSLDVLGRQGNSPGLAGSGTFEVRANSRSEVYEKLKSRKFVLNLTGYDLTGAKILKVSCVA